MKHTTKTYDNRHNRIIAALAEAGFVVQLTTVHGRLVQRGIAKRAQVQNAA
jgi:hypothetical protein